MPKIRAAAVSIAALVAFLPVRLLADSITDFGCASAQRAAIVSSDKVQAAYAVRSVAIVQAALAMNEDRLKTMIAPTALFAESQGDAVIRLSSTGSKAAILFWRGMLPRAFQYFVASNGPFGSDPCKEVTSTLTLTGDWPDRAIAATFSYRDGILIKATARRVSFVRGQFAP